MKTLLAGLLLAGAAAGSAMAQATPAGLWKTIDDDTKAEKSLVRVTEAGGVYTGKVDKILTDKTDAKCDKCSDERKDQPVQGMTIVTGMKRDVGSTGAGPDPGSEQRQGLPQPDEADRRRQKRMEVRGYMARRCWDAQTWHHEE
jgi:hypothetical protein